MIADDQIVNDRGDPVAVVAVNTEPLNAMVTPDQRDYVDRRAEEPGVSRAHVVREALELLMEAKPLPPPSE